MAATLLPLPADACPSCGSPLVVLSARQPAMFSHGGYGATERATTRACPAPACGWALLAEVQAERPPRTLAGASA